MANTITSSELPMDILLHHIAPRLPAKSVFRFMAVSKEFYSFLNTQKFTNMHLHRVINHHHQNHDKLLVLSTTWPYKFNTIDCEAAADDDDLTPTIRVVPFLASRKLIISSGLVVCVGHPLMIEGFLDLALWNPVTGDYRIVSITNFENPIVDTIFELYYSSCHHDYKLLHVTRFGEVYVYSMRSDSWRKLQVDSTSKLSHIKTLQSVWLNENLYFLKVEYPLSLIRFDPKTEKLTEIKTPSSLQVLLHRVRNASLFVHKGSIHLCAQYVETRGRCVKYETWRMNGDGDWSNVDIPGVHMSYPKKK